MSVVPGFNDDVFVSYAHLNDVPFGRGNEGWVTEFVQTLVYQLKARNRNFSIWFDPKLRTGEDFDDAIAKAISGSALFLGVLSPAYDDSSYCKKEVAEFRALRHPAFGMKVGTLSRMQAILFEKLPKDRWPPELRSTSPYHFCSETVPRFFKPAVPDENNPYIRGIWSICDSIWDTLGEMLRQKNQGTAVEQPYGIAESQAAAKPVVYLADVADDLFYKLENLRTALEQTREFQVEKLSAAGGRLEPYAVSVHLFGLLPGRPAPGDDLPLPRLQLESTLAASPARRPVVWLARDLRPEEAETKPHQEFLKSLLNHNQIELLRTTVEDLKEEIPARMRTRASQIMKMVRRRKGDSIVHIWHQMSPETPLDRLRERLKKDNCGISVFKYSSFEKEKLQSKLAFCDGLVLPYAAETKSWAEDIITETFQLRRREDRPIAFAAVELPPRGDVEFNFEHPKVVPIHATANGDFDGMDKFLERLEDGDV